MKRFILTILGVVCGCGQTPENKLLEAIAAVETGKQNGIDLRTTPLNDASVLSKLNGLQGLAALNLDFSTVSDDELRAIGPIPALKSLSLSKTQITQKAVSIIVEQFPNLEFLRLDETSTTDQSIANLVSLKQLAEISLYKTYLTDQCCGTLSQISSLEKVSLDQTSVTDGGLKILLENTSLKSVSVWGTQVTKQGFESAVAENPKVQINH